MSLSNFLVSSLFLASFQMRLLKVFQRIKHEETEVELDEEVDVLMSSDIVSAQMSTKPITFERTLSGWIFKHEKQVSIFRCRF